MTNPSEHTVPLPESADGDAVDFLIRQHHAVRQLFSEVADTTGPARHGAFERLVRLLAVHETAEEQLVHPLCGCGRS
jgi:hypothetical protein